MFEEENIVESLLPAVEEQLTSGDTKYVKTTFDRLMATGEEAEEVKMMIALCLTDEVNRMMIDKREFDPARYQEMLNALPELPE